MIEYVPNTFQGPPTVGGRSAHRRRTFPVTLVLEGEPCLVVGSGELAAARAGALAAAGAEVVVVTPRPGPALLALRGQVRLLRRSARPGDVEAAALVIFAEDDLCYDAELVEHARRLRRPVNVADVTGACSFYLPAVVQRGPVSVAISTAGHSPLLASRLRRRIEAELGPEVGALADLLGELRTEVKARYPDMQSRTAAWRRVVESDVPGLLAEGREAEAAARARALVEQE